MDKNNKRILIHKHMEQVTLKNSVDIILSPQFYTFIREELDIKFTYQVKPIAPSLLDDYVDDRIEYQYYVYKCKESWCLFAYDIKEIDTFLQSVGIEQHRVSKIYFAQQLSDQLDRPILLNEKYALQNIEETVTLVPTKFIDPTMEFKTLDLSAIKLSGGVTMGGSLNSLISLKESIILSLLFLTLGGSFILEGQRIKASISNEDTKLTELLNNNPKYTSSILRQSILDKYQPIDKAERTKRQTIKDISKLLSSNSQLKELTMDDNRITATIMASNRNVKRNIQTHAKAKRLKTSGQTLEIKVEKKL